VLPAAVAVPHESSAVTPASGDAQIGFLAVCSPFPSAAASLAARGTSHPVANCPGWLLATSPVGSKPQPSAAVGPRAAPRAGRGNAVFHLK